MKCVICLCELSPTDVQLGHYECFEQAFADYPREKLKAPAAEPAKAEDVVWSPAVGPTK